jgi:hypothetical protein
MEAQPVLERKDRTIKPGEYILWQSTDLVDRIECPLPKGGVISTTTNNPIEFVGRVYTVDSNSSTMKVHWMAYRISTPNGYNLVTRESVDCTEKRRAMFGTVTKDPTYSPFTKVGLSSLHVDMNSTSVTLTKDSYSNWWVPIVEKANGQWCSIM